MIAFIPPPLVIAGRGEGLRLRPSASKNRNFSLNFSSHILLRVFRSKKTQTTRPEQNKQNICCSFFESLAQVYIPHNRSKKKKKKNT